MEKSIPYRLVYGAKGMKFSREFLFDILDDDEVVIQNTVIDTWRWGDLNEAIFKYGDKLYSWCYRTQPEEGIQEYDNEFECDEVVPVQKMVTVYERITK